MELSGTPPVAVPISGLPLPDLTALFTANGLNTHQARLAFQAIHRHGLADPDAMPEISAACRAFLKTFPPLPELATDAVHEAQDGTTKLRLRTPTGDAIEAVLIPTPSRLTLCVSSQVGCAAACAFCHTGTMGLQRNLAAWEIVAQVRAAQRQAKRPITNIVFMGMGEPLHNEANVAAACQILGDDVGAGFPKRRLVVSTAGVGNRIRPFWERDVAALAVSLHATTDEIRSRIVPLNKQCNLAALKQTLLDLPWKQRDSLLVAYLLLDGVNDSREDAERLAEWVRGLPAKVNLLEFNPFPGSPFQRATPERLAEFRRWLDELDVFHTHRHSRGDDVMAACGQLALPRQKRR